ncbi:Aste57867_7694 [Aphanomyces stellatus]|uniref:Aste57867_7694 protein n=1 Tax=Aphanomyces stellatus TaxID=120398 RepID=A0A485KIM4_9STRA|nr:hypothetical protein As57867_007665 [Aphanomyces stellatus]VFT84597.1 Aste57867_7694 [Aphanomyces stellatus]
MIRMSMHVGAVLQQVEAVAARYHVGSTVQATIQLVADKAVVLDATFHVSQRVIRLDSAISGGMGQRGVESGKYLVTSGLTYVNDTLEQAKLAHANKAGASLVVADAATTLVKPTTDSVETTTDDAARSCVVDASSPRCAAATIMFMASFCRC